MIGRVFSTPSGGLPPRARPYPSRSQSVYCNPVLPLKQLKLYHIAEIKMETSGETYA